MTSRYIKLDGLAVNTVENHSLAHKINALIECDVDLLKRYLHELNFRQTLQLHECVDQRDIKTLKALLENQKVFVEYPVYGSLRGQRSKIQPAITKSDNKKPEEPEDQGDTGDDPEDELLKTVAAMRPDKKNKLRRTLGLIKNNKDTK